MELTRLCLNVASMTWLVSSAMYDNGQLKGHFDMSAGQLRLLGSCPQLQCGTKQMTEWTAIL